MVPRIQARASLALLAAVLACPTLARAEAAARDPDPAILDFRLGEPLNAVEKTLDAMKGDLPRRTIYNAQDPGGEKFIVALEAVSPDNMPSQDIFFQFSPPFDGNRLVALFRHVSYTYPGDPRSSEPGRLKAPGAPELEQALLERYGLHPLRRFGLSRYIWPLGPHILSDDEVLQRCFLDRGDGLAKAVQGCGRTMQAYIADDSSHPTKAMIFESALVDQDRIVGLAERFRDMAQAAKATAEAQAPKVPGAAPKL